MALTLVTTVQRFQALSTDAWPEDPPEGSTLHVVDTGAQYVSHDGTWEEDLRQIYAIQNA